MSDTDETSIIFRVDHDFKRKIKQLAIDEGYKTISSLIRSMLVARLRAYELNQSGISSTSGLEVDDSQAMTEVIEFLNKDKTHK